MIDICTLIDGMVRDQFYLHHYEDLVATSERPTRAQLANWEQKAAVLHNAASCEAVDRRLTKRLGAPARGSLVTGSRRNCAFASQIKLGPGDWHWRVGLVVCESPVRLIYCADTAVVTHPDGASLSSLYCLDLSRTAATSKACAQAWHALSVAMVPVVEDFRAGNSLAPYRERITDLLVAVDDAPAHARTS